MSEPTESDRRKPQATGLPVRLADGQTWLLAFPTFQPSPAGLTHPPIDGPLDRIFDGMALDEGISLTDAWEIARALLQENYQLADAELSSLLAVAPGQESSDLVAAVLDALFGSGDAPRSYTTWVRASLLANGLGTTPIAAHDLPTVLALLVATGRTVPVDRFADACRLATERSAFDSLI